MTSVTFCANCGAGMLHVDAETCSSFCRSELALRRAQLAETSPRDMSPLERMDAVQRYKDAVVASYQQPVSSEMLARAVRAVPPDVFRDDVAAFFGTDIGIPTHDVPAYELDQPDRAPAAIVWAMGGFFVAIGIILIWAFS